MATEKLENVIMFFDSVSKGMEGIKDKYSRIILDIEKGNDSVEYGLKMWVNATKQLIEDKYIQIFAEKYDDQIFEFKITSWTIMFGENEDLLMNIRILKKNIDDLKTTINNKILSSNPLCYINISEYLLNNYKNK